MAVDVLGDRLAAHEGDRLYAGVLEDAVDGVVGPVDDVEDALGQARLGEQLAELYGRERRPLGGLEDVGVAGGDGDGQRPQRHHAGEVERRDGRHHPEREPVGDVVYPARHVPGALAHQQAGHPAGELDHLYAPPDLAAGVLGVLAVLQGDQVPKLPEVLLQQHLVAEEEAGRARRRGCPTSPGRPPGPP